MAGRRLNFADAFRSVSDIHGFLVKDTLLALENLRDAVLAFDAGKTTDGFEPAFYAKAAIRAFLGHVDGIGYALRRAVLAYADTAGLALTTKQKAALLERKYDSQTDSITNEEKLASGL